MLLTSFSDSCRLAIVLVLGSLEMVLRRLSRFSLPVELPLFALNDEQIDALPNELYAIVLNRFDGSVSATLLLFEVDGCSVSSLRNENSLKYEIKTMVTRKIEVFRLLVNFGGLRIFIRWNGLIGAAASWLWIRSIGTIRSSRMILYNCLYWRGGWCDGSTVLNIGWP